MNVAEAIVSWLEYRLRMNALRLVAMSTLTNQSEIAKGLSEAFGETPLAELRKSQIELWMGARLQRCAPVTVRGEMNVLRQILRWCIDEGHMVQMPRLPKLAVPAVEQALPSDEAFAWVLAHVPPQHAAALEFMMLTGLSPHELERVQVQDAKRGQPGSMIETDRHHRPLNPNPDHLWIGLRPDFPVKQPSRRRTIPLNGRALQLWFEWTMGGVSTANPWPRVDAMQKAIRRAFLLQGSVPGSAEITPKMMRKWFASKVAGEQPEHVLQRLMGHAPGSDITRRHYVRSSDAEISAAVAGVAVKGSSL